jgi:hypothetical protein
MNPDNEKPVLQSVLALVDVQSGAQSWKCNYHLSTLSTVVKDLFGLEIRPLDLRDLITKRLAIWVHRTTSGYEIVPHAERLESLREQYHIDPQEQGQLTEKLISIWTRRAHERVELSEIITQAVMEHRRAGKALPTLESLEDMITRVYTCQI